MYLDRAVLIPKVKGISFRTKGENTYVQYEIGRVYNPEKKYNNPRRVDIGIRIPGQEEMMLPNENYLQYFSDEMEKAEGVREDLLGDYEEERQRRYALRELFLPIFYEFQAMGRRAPEEVVNEAKVERLNKILGPMMEMLQDEEYAEYLEMIPMPEKEAGKDGKVVWTGMSYSDVAMILNHFKSLGNRYFRKRFGARIKIVQNKVRDSVGYALYYIRQGGTHHAKTNQAAQPTVQTRCRQVCPGAS